MIPAFRVDCFVMFVFFCKHFCVQASEVSCCALRTKENSTLNSHRATEKICSLVQSCFIHVGSPLYSAIVRIMKMNPSLFPIHIPGVE